MNQQTQIQRLRELIRPRTDPLGAALISGGDSFPEHAIRPAKYGIRVSLCQWTTMARTWGRTVGVLPEDINCSACLAALGLMRLESPDHLAEYLLAMGYFETRDKAVLAVDQLDPLSAGAIKGIVLFPLGKESAIPPDLVWIYGTPAQMARLAAGWAYTTGELVGSKTTGFGFSCLSLFKPYRSGKPRLVHPGRGERILAGTEEDEMAFSFPAFALDDLVAGLEKTHDTGTRYPVQKYVIFQPPVLRPMSELEDRLSPIRTVSEG